MRHLEKGAVRCSAPGQMRTAILRSEPRQVCVPWLTETMHHR